MRILLLSPYHGGSHRAWAEGYQSHSNHDVRIVSLSAAFWKWRMEGGAITLARMTASILDNDQTQPDLILATDMLDLARFLGLTRRQTAGIPVALYMHENQLTYPLPADPDAGPMRRQHGARDRHFVLTNLTSMLAADHIYFNSDYHRRTFLEAVPTFLRHYPDHNESDLVDSIAAKSSVLPVGVDFARLDPPLAPPTNRPPLVLWNQRWEFDKNPEGFLSVLLQMANEGVEYELAVCGERFGLDMPEDNAALLALGKRVIHNGYANDSDYRRLLWESTVTFSTASHEYFGISMLEAIHCHTFPLLPPELSYPEIIPAEFHEACLVERADLLPRLHWVLRHPQEARTIAARLAAATAELGWPVVADVYDEQFEGLVDSLR